MLSMIGFGGCWGEEVVINSRAHSKYFARGYGEYPMEFSVDCLSLVKTA